MLKSPNTNQIRGSFTQKKKNFVQKRNCANSKQGDDNKNHKKSLTNRLLKHMNTSFKITKRTSESDETFASSAMCSIDSDAAIYGPTALLSPVENRKEELKKDFALMMEEQSKKDLRDKLQKSSSKRNLRRKSEVTQQEHGEKSKYKQEYEVLSKQVSRRVLKNEGDAESPRNGPSRGLARGASYKNRASNPDASMPMRRTNSLRAVLRSDSIKNIIVDLKAETLEDQEELSSVNATKVLHTKKNSDHMLHLLTT